ncbi:PEGA domain-containing protein [bacterium]|nr:PEGA domain-containing protein [bacterium]
MKIKILLIVIIILIQCIACGGGKNLLKLGASPLTIQVTSPDPAFDGNANIYINTQFIGTTDSQTGTLKINLKKGEYIIVVAADGYKPWRKKITLLGNEYKQTALARLTLVLPEELAAETPVRLIE